MKTTIYYTKVDEAPALATASLLPILNAFCAHTTIKFIQKDISLAGRILAQFPDCLKPHQQVSDDLAFLAKQTQDPTCNIIKLPNISASVSQLKAAINELQSQGYAIPDFPEPVKSVQDQDVMQRYQAVLGSAVNPVLREGNSDRRAPKSVKAMAQKFPHSLAPWLKDSKTQINSMSEGDFYANQQAVKLQQAASLSIVFSNKQGESSQLASGIQVATNDYIEASFMSMDKLKGFYKEQLNCAKEQDLLVSLHLKATMMKVSDPILLGAMIEIFFESLFKKHSKTFDDLGINANLGLADMLQKLSHLSKADEQAIRKDIEKIRRQMPELAMVDSDKDITNLHVPSDVIIDASIPAMIKQGGKMWAQDGTLKDTLALIPDSCYAGVYKEVLADCKRNGAFDPSTMGSVSNIGLMAKKAQEYGSHNTTFQMIEDGYVHVVDELNNAYLKFKVSKGDIWRLCLTKTDAVDDWIQLAFKRSLEQKKPVVFWLDQHRAHDQQLIDRVNELHHERYSNQDFKILAPQDATAFSLQRLRSGLDTIAATGNVLRDYLTDLFPILELGTSAKMLSIVPLMKGGGLFETGAGGSAPKHVQQLVAENHLRWDSLGEFLAIQACFEQMAIQTNDNAIQVLAETLNWAIQKLLENNQSPKRNVGQLDSRGSHVYLAYYWLEALASQDQDSGLSERFSKAFNDLDSKLSQILKDLSDCQGKTVSLGGYYFPQVNKLNEVMRPSRVLNQFIHNLLTGQQSCC